MIPGPTPARGRQHFSWTWGLLPQRHGQLFPGECGRQEPSGHQGVSAWHLSLQGDDSLSAITLDSDCETVSVVGRPPSVPGLAAPGHDSVTVCPQHGCVSAWSAKPRRYSALVEWRVSGWG